MGKITRFFLMAIATAAVFGCAWQRVDQPAAYRAEQIPIVVGLNPSESPFAKGLAPDLATELEVIGLFDKIIYPYREGDKVHCLLEFDATGLAEGHGVGAGVAGHHVL